VRWYAAAQCNNIQMTSVSRAHRYANTDGPNTTPLLMAMKHAHEGYPNQQALCAEIDVENKAARRITERIYRTIGTDLHLHEGLIPRSQIELRSAKVLA
jgi:hypothetical protein